MLIIPVLTNTSKKSIPYVCLALVILNAFIYFVVQSGDDEIYEEAYGYYHNSGLQTIELKAYITFLNKTGDNLSESILSDDKGRNKLSRKMFSDETFMDLLVDNMIISSGDEDFDGWRERRDHFEETKDSTIIQRFGYSPKKNNYIALLTCVFLHGSTMHLVGNMVFLWLVGAILEKAIGPVYFLGLYLVTGVCASLLFGFVYPVAMGPLVGASGAIAGLMGAYGVIFFLRKVRVFYSLGFYFNYANVPAITLFPFWLINEIIQLNMNDMSNVAYMAHIGGLLSGITIGVCYRTILKDRIENLFARDERGENLEKYLTNGMDYLASLDLKKARKEFLKVLDMESGHPAAIRQLYAIDKTQPQSEEFQISFKRLMEKLQVENTEDYIQTFEEYKKITPKVLLTKGQLEHVSFLYLQRKEMGKAAQCISALYKNHPGSSNLPGYLLSLAQYFMDENKKKEALNCCKVLSKKYGATPEGEKATKYLAGQTA